MTLIGELEKAKIKYWENESIYNFGCIEGLDETEHVIESKSKIWLKKLDHKIQYNELIKTHNLKEKDIINATFRRGIIDGIKEGINIVKENNK